MDPIGNKVRPGRLSLKPSWSDLRPDWLYLRSGWLALRPYWLLGSPEAYWPWGNGNREFLSILKFFIPYWGRCPKHENMRLKMEFEINLVDKWL